jgi:hypothetical protein
MRTTLNIDDEVLEMAKSYAAARKVTVGEALSDLVRKGLDAPVGTRTDPETGWLMFDVSGMRPFGLEEVQHALDQDDLEYARSMKKP